MRNTTNTSTAEKATLATPRDVRRAAGVTIEQAAVRARVTSPTVRLYEANPLAVKDQRKRASLDALYLSLAAPTGPAAA